MHLFGRQNLILRGHRESIADQKISDNPGHFIAFLREIANYSPEIAEHINNPAMKNATYLSPRNQNEFIDI